MGKGKSYGTANDVALCKAWCDTTEDPIIGTNQDSKTFWSRVYNGYVEETNGDESRTARALQNRFNIISRAVMKFVGCHEVASRTVASGQNEQDIMTVAMKSYWGENGKSIFDHIECWELLRNKPKFLTWMEKSTPSKQRRGSLSDSNSLEGELPAEELSDKSKFVDENRPIGVKKAKREISSMKFMENIASIMRESNFMAKQRMTIMQLMTGAIIYGVRDEIPSNKSKAFFEFAEKRLLEDMQAPQIGDPPPTMASTSISPATMPSQTIPTAFVPNSVIPPTDPPFTVVPTNEPCSIPVPLTPSYSIPFTTSCRPSMEIPVIPQSFVSRSVGNGAPISGQHSLPEYEDPFYFHGATGVPNYFHRPVLENANVPDHNGMESAAQQRNPSLNFNLGL